jgi:hypothetical protein
LFGLSNGNISNAFFGFKGYHPGRPRNNSEMTWASTIFAAISKNRDGLNREAGWNSSVPGTLKIPMSAGLKRV